jgi:epoxyqueuosine reductase
VKPLPLELRAAELEELVRRQGFHRVAAVHSTALPPGIARHPQTRALGRGTFLMAALSCYREEPEDLSTPGDPHTLIAPFARRNYYREAVARLKAVVRTLGSTHGLSRQSSRIFCNSRLPEKALAVVSGLGSPGKNTLVLIPGMGSLFIIAGLFLPVLVAEIPEPGQSPPDGAFSLCGSCRACRDACPVDALHQPGLLDDSRCLQALCTRPVPFSQSHRLAWAFRFYGCQSCQDACPHNRTLSLQTPTDRGELGPGLSLKQVLALSTTGIRELLRGSALARSWIPPQTLLRNALLAAGNRQDPVLSDLVAGHVSSPDPLVAGAAAWAAERISDARGGTRQ